MKQSAQAIVVDRKGKIYLEDNEVTNMLSFIWWKLEDTEDFITTVIREVEEELGLVFPEIRFLDGQEQPERKFWNTKLQDFISWKSKYFVLVLTDEEVKDINENIKLVILNSIFDLDMIHEGKFWPLWRGIFRAQIQRALSHIS